MSWLFGDTLSSANQDSPVGYAGEKVQRWTDPLSWVSGGKWADFTSKTLPDLTNKGLGYITRPAQKIDSYIDPLQQTAMGKSLGNFVTNKPGDSIGIAIGSIFTGGALGGAVAGGADGGAAAGAGVGAADAGAADAAGSAAAGSAATATADGAGAAAAGDGFGGFGGLLGSDSLGGLESGATVGGDTGAASGGLGSGLDGFFGGSSSLGDSGMGSGLFTGGGEGLDGTYGSTLDANPTGIGSGLPGASDGGYNYTNQNLQQQSQQQLKNGQQNATPHAAGNPVQGMGGGGARSAYQPIQTVIPETHGNTATPAPGQASTLATMSPQAQQILARALSGNGLEGLSYGIA